MKNKTSAIQFNLTNYMHNRVPWATSQIVNEELPDEADAKNVWECQGQNFPKKLTMKMLRINLISNGEKYLLNHYL